MIFRIRENDLYSLAMSGNHEYYTKTHKISKIINGKEHNETTVGQVYCIVYDTDGRTLAVFYNQLNKPMNNTSDMWVVDVHKKHINGNDDYEALYNFLRLNHIKFTVESTSQSKPFMIDNVNLVVQIDSKIVQVIHPSDDKDRSTFHNKYNSVGEAKRTFDHIVRQFKIFNGYGARLSWFDNEITYKKMIIELANGKSFEVPRKGRVELI